MTREGIARFVYDTHVREVGDGMFEAEVDRSWWIVNGPNGGYLAAIIVRSLEASIDDPSRRVKSITLSYLRPPKEGLLRVSVQVVKSGRLVTFVRFEAVQEDRAVIAGSASLATTREMHEFNDRTMPEVVPPSEITPREEGSAMIAMSQHYDFRPCVGSARLDVGVPGPAHSGGWMRLVDPTPIDAALLTALSDAWWPPVFHRLQLTNAVPTVDLTVHILAAETIPDQWVLGEFRSDVAAGGFIVEDAWLWSESGELLAQARQLAVLA